MQSVYDSHYGLFVDKVAGLLENGGMVAVS